LAANLRRACLHQLGVSSLTGSGCRKGVGNWETGDQSLVRGGTKAGTPFLQCLTLSCSALRQAQGFGAGAGDWPGRGLCANEALFLI